MTNNCSYLQHTMANSETIIDTASLMHPGFKSFMKENAEILLESGFKIIISRDVRMELIKFMTGSNSEKAALALRASNVIAEYKDIFIIEPGHVSDEEVFKAFADRAILARLTSNSGDTSQLLITNDKRLARDAFNINNLGSCRSRRIKVCYLNDDGNLCRCECTIPKSTEESDAVTEDNMPSDIQSDSISDTVPSNGPSTISNVIIGGSLFSLGIVVGKFLL